MRLYRLTALLHVTAIVITISCKVQITPVHMETGDGERRETDTTIEKGDDKKRFVYRFFDEDFVSGGYSYIYPDESKVFIEEGISKNGEVALHFELVADDYSGGSICLYNLLYDVTPYIATGALEFWIKGDQGGEVAWVALVDDETGDGCKTAVRLPMNDYGGITKEWTKLSIPLRDFGNRGLYWDAKKRVEVPKKFDWDKVAEFRILINKGDNQSFKVWADDLFIYSNVFELKAPDATNKEEYWDEREETLEAIPIDEQPDIKVVHEIFTNDLPAGGFAYVYGGKTAYKIQHSEGETEEVLAMYMDGSDYSGVTISLGVGKTINLKKARDTNAALAFWLQASPGVKKVSVGLLDGDSDGKKVQTRINPDSYGKVTPSWYYFMIPLKSFSHRGKWWDDKRQAEIDGEVDWDKINEFRFSVNKFENKVPENEPLTVYVDNLVIIEKIPGWIYPDEYWSSFSSNAPDIILHDFERSEDQKWIASNGPKSNIQISYSENRDQNKYGTHSMQITYKLLDWADAIYNYKENNTPAINRDWTKHWALRFSLFSEKPYQAINVQVGDAGNELFIADAGGSKGWNDILVPFKDFYKFPYYQPPEAIENGTFDLNCILSIDFKPGGEGSAGTFRIDNVTLTNIRQIKKLVPPKEIPVTITGDMSRVVTKKINDGIFGINVATWDTDLLKPETAEYVKELNHGVLRYPGGLSADAEHWKEILDKKDSKVDIDEFMAFCKKTGNRAMITVNFGRGTPQEAADWVNYINIDKGYNIRYWEIGNELYGEWHGSHCSADEYGKRAATFIRAMKAVDPAILVGVVWVLEGLWNDTVFHYTKDIADGVIVHHYAQHAGQENDRALLAAPQSLERMLSEVRKQIDRYGSKGKKYRIWLTEWNSVDTRPSPQILSVVNGLFVIDYLGMLAKINIEQASYWIVHNDMTAEGGDYGYLSRTGAPDGDNVPRSSYYAFKLAGMAFRGSMLHAASSSDYVSAYLTGGKNGTKVLTLINKMPGTSAKCFVKIPGVQGNATAVEYTKMNMTKGLSAKEIVLRDNDSIIVEPYSAVALFVK